jgi:outer membrane protein
MDGYGSIALDSGSLTIAPELRWDFIDTPNAGIGLLVGYRAGRNDRNPSFASANDGSNRLHGLPDVSNTIDAGVAGHVALLGVPIFAQVRSALSGTQGILLNLGIYLPFEPAPDFELTVLPTLTWANARQMRALYGVTPAAAMASGFAPYDTGGGWENAAVEIGGDWRISGVWHLIASAAYQHLLGSAARSSIVQTANQSSALIGIAFHF